MKTSLLPLFLASCAAITVAPAQFDWRDRTGYPEFLNLVGSNPPDGSGVLVIQAEAATTQGGNEHLPDVNSSRLQNRTFTSANGPYTFSGHANNVALTFYGDEVPNTIRGSVATGIDDILVYDANSYLNALFQDNLPTDRKVHSNAWIAPDLNSNGLNLRTTILASSDNTIANRKFLTINGLNNGSGSVVPDVYGHLLNGLSVGLSENLNSNVGPGNHSRGGTYRSDYFPGRSKPEIVVPSDFVSFGTGSVAGVAATLYDVADNSAALSDANDNSEVMKAILMAGATKEGLDGWDRTSSRPLDEVYGSGQINIANSYQILIAGSQNSTGTAQRTGWDFSSVSGFGTNTRNYNFTIPAAAPANILSAVLTWHHVSASPASPSPIVNLDLALNRVTPDGLVLIDQSQSTVNNIEHIYRRQLAPGDYRLTVSVPLTGATQSYGIAWQTQLGNKPYLHANADAPAPEIALHGLVAGRPYQIQRTFSLSAPSWQTLHTFNAPADNLLDWSDPAGVSTTQNLAAYRLRWTTP